ncbi:exodeoxyribonuclease V subunit alpha [Neisseria sp. Ec49-e6-T10]|uniref:exodeoxyribonuclease V subunit alpha n=1 Tax=Neisseria sp. Ec49-e6-T10 TaxID=3140744 RepID=UPI003EC12583
MEQEAKRDLPHVLKAINWALKHLAPQIFPIVEPYVEALFFAEENGHTYIELTNEDVIKLKKAYPIVAEGQESTPLVLWQNKLFFARLYLFEKQLAGYVSDCLKTQNTLFLPDQNACKQAQHILTKLFQNDFNEQQQQAVALALFKKLLLINGGPGTGKTTTVAKLLTALILLQSSNDLSIALAAPTGKAAARMTQALHQALIRLDHSIVQEKLGQLTAQTVHRLLGIHPITAQPTYHHKQSMPFDVIVIDEASMLDLPMLSKLFCAVKPEATLILLGDKNQLPSIGAGAFIKQLSTLSQADHKTNNLLVQLLPNYTVSDAQHSVGMAAITLKQSHRFDHNSAIGQLAQAINQQNNQLVQKLFIEEEKLALIEQSTSKYTKFYQNTSAYWQAVTKEDIPQVFNQYSKLMVLTVLKHQAEEFNQQYVHFLRTKKHHKGEPFFAGLPIMVTQNDYQLGLFNGDVGIILPDYTNKLVAYFEEANGFRKIPLSQLPLFDPAFAITVHKSQGSEYENVWLIGTPEPHLLFSNALLYTALTRAKASFILWAKAKVLNSAVSHVQDRRSALSFFWNQ